MWGSGIVGLRWRWRLWFRGGFGVVGFGGGRTVGLGGLVMV